jgi:hypothetical protein
MTPDGSKVYFTSAERLTSEDQDTSADLYMWTEATNSLTLVSKGSDGAGNSDACNSDFTAKCGVVPYSNISYCQLLSGEGGNCHSDSSIASENGDIYFFSPEQLDGSRGIPNQENLYDFRDGKIQYVAAFTGGPFCFKSPIGGSSDSACSDTPVTRMEVSPDDSTMAFVTASPVTQYDNAGHLEMYVYDPSARTIVCASCIPDGEPPSADVGASQNGLFMTNDGRVFFTTDDALVHGDTNRAIDVYEYVNGRPQLITPGTGETSIPGGFVSAVQNAPGFAGVSADGTDAYFSTYDTLVPQDHNGLFLKFYDARTGGGFSAPAPPPACEAADECHGAGSSAPAPIESGTNAALTGGNAKTTHKKRPHRAKKAHRKHHRRARHHRHAKRHRANARRGQRGGSR